MQGWPTNFKAMLGGVRSAEQAGANGLRSMLSSILGVADSDEAVLRAVVALGVELAVLKSTGWVCLDCGADHGDSCRIPCSECGSVRVVAPAIVKQLRGAGR